ncbi:hypothetical protein DIC66_20215 [Rhodoferax lacus]|uniref:Uncharacterized protein n=1 Tax=Rhodoferax lacus TaxID=2184758 RepID=A0A3E1R6V5_9BURK|nr:hypothetical protein [Rhodoferax lacus]RFO95084.1 hypothetical protein DIC66_20215 [Rhodoferax lacus]
METQSIAKLFGLRRHIAAKTALMAWGLCMAFAAAAGPLSLSVRGVGHSGIDTGVELTDYRWTVEEDATKLSVPGVPATQANYSFSFHTSYMPVVAAGRVGTEKTGVVQDPDVARLYATTLPEVCSLTSGSTCLDPAKRYYVSVAADGHQMGGAPVVFSGGNASAKVFVNQYALPTAQVSVFAFNDNSPINGAPDLPQETGLAGFTVQLMEAGGTYGQSGGAVTQDGFGNPLGTTYKRDPATGGALLNADGKPVVAVKGNGIILTGPDGTAVIKNLFPAKYTVFMVPPANTDWHQTSTIEGTRGSDAWVKNNEPSFFQEFGPPGHHVFMGFTKSGCVQGTGGRNNPGRCAGLTGGTPHTITGRVVNVHNSRTPNYAFEKGAPVPECWVGLNETGGGTRALYAAACKKDSTFSIAGVPPGTYELVVWDEPLDMIIGTQTVTVGSTNVDMKDVPVFSWFGRYQGRVFQDIDGTGLPFFAEAFNKPYIKVDPVTGRESLDTKKYAAGDLKPAFGEGIANNIRFRDGSIYQSVVTKQDGTFAFTEVFPFFNWMIAEIDYARFKATGATMVADGGGVIDPAANAAKLWKAEKGSFGSSDPTQAYDPWIRLNPQQQADGKYYRNENCAENGGQCATLLEGMQTFLGQTNHIEWGKQPFAGQLNGPKNENGGIAGIVHYSITRAEDDPRLATAENWEPGVPRVQINMFLDCDGDGKVDQPKNDGSGQCSALSSAGYQYAQPDVDNYPFCWREPDSCGLDVGQQGPEDIKNSGPLETAFSFGDVFRWGSPNTPAADKQLHVGMGATDSWDDNLPRGCVKAAAGPVGNGNTPFKDTLDCFDGLYNFNQLRPSVFDGGYAFGRVAGQAELPVLIGTEGKGTYILQAIAPPGYLHQGNGDKNVTFGDTLAASPAALPFPCVGMELPVPEFLSLFPGEPNPNYTGPGQTWNKCDMKAVALLPGTNPAPDFFMFTEAPVAGHGVGFILDDTATEFNRFAPTFGEKYAPPYLPISVQDWTGREITRAYSDQFGSYNFLVPSSFTINPPFPSGVMPNMIVSCMNHPGPIEDTRELVGGVANPTFGQKIIDPYFNRKYTQFCYTLQYLPGKTTYLDTPVLPIAAFANIDKNPLDCECQDKTPAIYSANNNSTNSNGANANYGPWVNSATGGGLTIVSMGAQAEVPNPAYDPAVDGSPKNILRDYGFGTVRGTVKLGNTTLAVSTWTADLLTVTVPAGTPSGQLTITRGDNGKESVVGLTVHTGITPPKVVAPGASIQAVIDDANTRAGDLITVPPGTYNEYLILDKRVRLQGWGAGSVTINASKSSAGGLAAWRKLLNKKVDARCGTDNGSLAVDACPANTPVDVDTGAPTVVAGRNRTFDPLPGQTLGINKSNNEPILFGAEEGAGILAVGRARQLNDGSFVCASAGSQDYRIDGLTITGSDSGGGVLASGYNCGLNITNNRVASNYGTYGGGIRVGHTALDSADLFTDGNNNNVLIDHNWVSQNGASEIASGDGGGGGITLGTGSNGYQVTNNYICGNFSMSDGGGISHVGLSSGANSIVNNKILLNQTFNQSADPTGGGLYIGGQVPIGGGTSVGTGSVTVDRNLIQYNHAGAGAGGGVSIARASGNNDNLLLTNNLIANNAAAYTGGGVAVADVSNRVRLVNNTVADNVSTATNRQSFPAGPKVQSTAQIGGIARVSGAAPTLLNNIIWNNQSFTWKLTPATATSTELTALTPAGVSDLSIGTAAPLLASSNSVLSTNDSLTNCSNCRVTDAAGIAFVKRISLVSQIDNDQPLVLPETTIMQTALTFDEGGNFINVNFSPLTPWDLADPSKLRSDYHIAATSVAVDKGASGTGVPTVDYDAQTRVSPVDVGADEVQAVVPPPPVKPTLAPLDSFNRANANTLGGSWSQAALQFLGASIRVNNNQASAVLPGNAYWNGTGAVFAAKQAAAFTMATNTPAGNSLLLKASGNFNLGAYQNAIRVRYVQNTGVVVDTTGNGGLSYTPSGTLAAALLVGDTLTAQVDATGLVTVWKTTGTTNTLLGTAPTSFTAGGRIGLQLPNGGRVDDFAGGTVP